MRIAVAGFALESASFLPGETDEEDFEREARRGQDLIESLRGTATVGGGFIQALDAAGAEMVPLVYTDLSAAGHASDRAFDAFCGEICRGLATRAPLDGVLLYLHGATTTPLRLDPEEDLLRAVRAVIGPDLPLVVAFDLHANLSLATAALATALVGFHYSPHTDMAETGARAARLLLGTLRGDIRPVTALVKVPLVLPSIFTATALPPLSEFVADGIARERREPDLLDISIFCGFAYADVPDIGASVAVVADGDRRLAEAVARDLAERLWDARHELLHPDMVLDVEDGLERAAELVRRGRRPVVLLEHADRRNDSTWGLRAVLNRPELRVAAPYLWDPEAARRCQEAGPGQHVVLAVGGRSSARAGGPVEISAEIRFAGPKSYLGTGPMRLGRRVELGVAALLDTGSLLLSITSNPVTAIDEDPFLQFDLNPRDFDVILLRSKTHFRAVYEAIAAEILIIDTPDWGTADLRSLPYRNVGPGMFPITTRA